MANKEILSLPVTQLKLSQATQDKLTLSGIDKLEDFNTFSLKELQMLLGDSFNEVLPTLVFYKIPRNVSDLSLSSETVDVLATAGIRDLETLLKYDRHALFHIFEQDEFLLKEINDLLTLYKHEPLHEEIHEEVHHEETEVIDLESRYQVKVAPTRKGYGSRTYT